MTQNAQTYGQNKRWVRLKVDPADLRPLMKREDARPFRDMFIWLALMGGFACLTCLLWGSWYAVIPLLSIVYCIVLARSHGNTRLAMAQPLKRKH